MILREYLDKENLHHAYLIEGAREEIVPELKLFIEEMGVPILGNSDFIHIHLDTFKIDDARELKAYGSQKGISLGKKIFIVSTNSFLAEAQNALLKMFEEPIENTHFFLVMPDINSLLKTVVSRFFVIRAGKEKNELNSRAEKFLAMDLRSRMEFIKDLLVESEEEDEDGKEILASDSIRSSALDFLNSLESSLHERLPQDYSLQVSLDHLLKVRKYLRMPGSSVKNMMESVALMIPGNP